MSILRSSVSSVAGVDGVEITNINDIEIWTTDSIENLMPHLFRLASPGSKQQRGSTAKNSDSNTSKPKTAAASTGGAAAGAAPKANVTKSNRDADGNVIVKKKIMPEDLYPERVSNVIQTFCIKLSPHAHGEYLIHEHVFHEHCKVGEGWKGFYQLNRKKYKPTKFKYAYYITGIQNPNAASGDLDNLWTFAREIIKTYHSFPV